MSRDDKPAALAAVIIMGVAGSGKSTIAEAFAAETGFVLEDGDAFHPRSNVEKMSAGTPLTDEDRWPWLRAIAAAIDSRAAAGEPIVVACSALRRAYRDILVHGRDDVRIVYLRGSRELIAERLKARRGHFMPASLLSSQFAALEEPGGDEPAIAVDIDRTVDAIVEEIVWRLGLAQNQPPHLR